MKVLCVLNPLSGGGLALQRWPHVVDLFKSFGISYERLADSGNPIERQVLQRLESGSPSEFDAIAGIGGDGTQSAAINGLMAYSTSHPESTLPPYGFIPVGVGNDIAKSFGLTSRADFLVDDLRRAVSTLVHGADYRLDLGLLNGRYFADAVTIGVDSHILRDRNRQKRWMDRVPALRRFAGSAMLYTSVCWSRIWKHTPRNAEVKVDGAVWYAGPVMNLIINNTRIYAGEFDFCTGGAGNDGLLDVILFTGQRDYLGRYLLSLRYYPRNIRHMANKLARSSSHIQGRHIEISLSQAEAAQQDGEELPSCDRFDIRVAPNAIHIRTPAEP